METHLGLNGTRLKENTQNQVLKAYISLLALWSMEIQIETDFGDKKEKDHGHSQQIKVNNFTVNLWVKRREYLFQSQLIATKTGNALRSIRPYWFELKLWTFGDINSTI